jgi:Protein of unknown function (DUF3225)
MKQPMGKGLSGQENLPEVVDEVRGAFRLYEQALVDDDAPKMNALFRDSPDTLRFGIVDAQTSFKSLAEWRSRQPPIPAGRGLEDTRIVTFGQDTAVVTTLFRYPGRPMVGRQTQVWIRGDRGWQIVSAHVSEIVDQVTARGQ